MIYSICSIYMPLRLRGYEAEGKLNVFLLAQSLILFFSLYLIYLLLNTVFYKSSCFQMIYLKYGNRVKVRYLLNHDFVRHHVP